MSGFAHLRRSPCVPRERAAAPGICASVQNLTPLLLIVACVVAASAGAQEAAAPLKDPGQKTVRIVRTAVKPTIDGIVNEAEWAGAARIDDLHQVNPVEYAPAVRALRDLPLLRRQRAVHRREAVPAAGHDHGEHAAPERLDHAGRHAVRHARSVQHAPRRLLLRAQRERRALRRPVPQRVGVLHRLGRDLGRGRDEVRRRLDGGVRDSVQVAVVRPEHRCVGPELLAHHQTSQRGHGVGVAQPALGSEHRRAHDGSYGDQSGHRPRHRSVGGRHGTSACSQPACRAPIRSRRSTCSTNSRRS